MHTLLVSLTVINEGVFVMEMTCVLYEKQTEFLRTARTCLAFFTGEISYFFRLNVMDFIMEQWVANFDLCALVFA